MNAPKMGRTGPSNFCGINIRKYIMAISGNLKSGTKKSELSGKQAIKKYPDMMLIPTRYLGVSFCLKEVS